MDGCSRCGKPGMATVVHECDSLPMVTPVVRIFESPLEARLHGRVDDLQAEMMALASRVRVLEREAGQWKKS